LTVERNSSDEAFRERYRQDTPEAAPIATRLIAWSRTHGLELRPRAGPTHDTLLCFLKLGGNEHKVFALETNGLIWILFAELERRFPSTEPEKAAAYFASLREKLGAVRGSRADASRWGGKASWRLKDTDETALTAVLKWVVDELRRHWEDLLESQRRRRQE
jgi:hypothetical protein